MPVHLGVPDAAYVQPLLTGLGPEFQILTDVPANLARVFRERIPPFHEAGCAFLSPIDYARHGGDYRILPGVCVSSSTPSGTITLFVKQDVRSIRTVAVDVRYTSEIVLAKIIIAERYPGLPGEEEIQIVPMMADHETMLRKTDAALVVTPRPVQTAASSLFSLDLVEEWKELTELPYVHGMWVGREEIEQKPFLTELVQMSPKELRPTNELTGPLVQDSGVSPEEVVKYLSHFSYTMGEQEEAGLTEFIRFAYYHGILPDAPELNFFDLTSPSAPSLN